MDVTDRSYAEGRTLDFPPTNLETFQPAVAQGSWRPWSLAK